MKMFFVSLLMSHSLLASVVGKPAPDFSALGSDGKTWKLSDQKGKVVVLEWFNESCPFVRKHYSSGNMQKLQTQATKKGVVWFTVLSSAPGKQGFMTGPELKKSLEKLKAASTVGLLDPTGELGKAYDAKTTPHLYVVDEKGELVYNGAIDDNPSSDPNTAAGAKNYLSAALEDVFSRRPVKEATTKPYGCAVKYP